MRPANPAPTVFSTAGVPGVRRIELWESHNATALIGLTVSAARPLEATEVNVQLPGVQLARVTGSPHAVERSAGLIRRDPGDAIAVYLSLRGDSWFRDDRGTHSLRAGSAVICETDRPFARGFPRGLEELVVKADRGVLAARGLFRLAAPAMAPAPGSADYARALARVAGRATLRARPVLPAEEGTVLDLVTALASGRRAASSVAHRAAARSFIDDHLTEPGLGAARIAAAIGISERQLSRVFAAGDTSVPRHILASRLRLAYSLLAAPAGPSGTGTVAEVAARCGFTSAAYFSHAFREHFGERASDVRRPAGLLLFSAILGRRPWPGPAAGQQSRHACV
jgi:AraC-like DNA-binding protein